MSEGPKTWKDGKLVELTEAASAEMVKEADERFHSANPAKAREPRYERSANLTQRVAKTLDWRRLIVSTAVVVGIVVTASLLWPGVTAGVWIPLVGLAVGIGISAAFARRNDEPFG